MRSKVSMPFIFGISMSRRTISTSSYLSLFSASIPDSAKSTSYSFPRMTFVLIRFILSSSTIKMRFFIMAASHFIPEQILRPVGLILNESGKKIRPVFRRSFRAGICSDRSVVTARKGHRAALHCPKACRGPV